MDIINTYEDFLKVLNDSYYSKREDFEYQDEGMYLKNNRIIKNIIFKDFEIKEDLYNIVFQNCEFISISFSNTHTTSCIFNKCKFTYLKAFNTFDRIVFLESEINESFFYTVNFYSIIFDKSSLFNCNISFSSHNLIIKDSELFSCDFSQAMTSSMSLNKVILKSSSIGSCTIHIMKPKNFHFDNCELSFNNFHYSELNNNVFVNNTRTIYDHYSHIDLSTLNWSEKLSPDILKNIFSVHNSDIQIYVKECFTEIKYETVFISYSFKNNLFAKMLSQELLLRGVRTWLWEVDAPGGKPLKEIMYNSIQENDRVIFICSKDSLISPACHYEISEARNKGKKLRKDIPFPINFDGGLFDVKCIQDIEKYEENADEWIKNINWIKKYNVLDFTEFSQLNFDTMKFSKMMDKIAKDLQKPIEQE